LRNWEGGGGGGAEEGGKMEGKFFGGIKGGERKNFPKQGKEEREG